MGKKEFFSGRIQLIKSLIYSENYERASKEINDLELDFPKKNNDLKVALQCSLAISQNKYDMGIKLTKKFINSNSKQALGLKKICLQELIKDLTIPFQTRKVYQSQLDGMAEVEVTNIEEIDE